MEWPGEVTLAGRDPPSVCHEVQACMPMHAMHGPCMAHATWEGGPRGLHCQVHASSWWVADAWCRDKQLEQGGQAACTPASGGASDL